MSTPGKPRSSAAKNKAVKPSNKLPPAKKGERDEKRWRAFAREYVKDFNGAQAAIRAGYSAKSARSIAARLLTKDNIQKFVAEANQRIVEVAEVAGADVVRHLHDMLLADPRELVEVYVGCCRHCYGVGYDYQYTLGEYNSKREKWLDEGKPIEKFEERGGVGYDARKVPAEDCPECFGEGQPRTVMKDTRRMSKRAVSLFAGVKLAAGGVMATQMHSQLDVVEKLMRHHGQYLADNKQQAGGNVPGVWTVNFVEPAPHPNDPLLQAPGAPPAEGKK